MNSADVVIIGSGISSLTCAALLSKSGKSVIVLERYSKVGGYLHCFSRFGERFDTGAHYVGAMGKGQPFHSLLTYLGILGSPGEPELFVPLDPSGFDVLHFPNFTLEMPQGYTAAMERFVDAFPFEASAIQKYFQMIQDAVKYFPTYVFEEQSAQMPLWVLETSLASVVKNLTSNPRLQCALYSYCSLHGVTPEDVGFGFHAIVTDSLIRGPHGLAQGGDALARSFVKQIEKNGGRVLTGQKVQELEVTGRLVTGVVTQKGERFTGDWIISGIHPKATLRLLNQTEMLTPAFRGRVSTLKESVGLFGVYAASKLEKPIFNRLRNYYFFNSEKPEEFLLPSPMDRPDSISKAVFLSPARRIAPENSGQNYFPLNMHSASVSDWFEPWKDSTYGKRPPEYQQRKNLIAQGIFSAVEKYYPGFQDSIDQFVTSSPLSNLHFNGSEEGSSYGIYHSIENTGMRALGPRTKVANLLLTGQSSLFPGLLGAATSALRTSGHIIGIKPILGELKRMENIS